MPQIAVIDDSKVCQMLIAGLLKGHPEYHVEVFDGARQALQHFAESPPDLVITDLVMPQMDGFELVQEMKALYPQIPSIVMTAYGNESIAVKALEGGAASYVPKARQADCLLETVGRVLARTEADHHRDLMSEYMVTMDCEFSLDRNPMLIPPLLDHLQNRIASICLCAPLERVRAMLALEEALLTAMAADDSLKRDQRPTDSVEINRAERLESLIRQRKQSPDLCGKRVRLMVRISEEGAWFRVRNEFGGIRAPRGGSSACDRVSCFESGNGRAPMLVQTLMDEVVYNGASGEVILVKRSRWPTTL